MRDLETIIVLILLSFNFTPQRSHYSLTLTTSRLRDSATVTLTPGDGTTAIQVATDRQIIIIIIIKRGRQCKAERK